MPRHTLAEPVVAWSDGEDRPDRPLVVLLHGRGADERSILGLAEHLPQRLSYAAVRAPIGEGGMGVVHLAQGPDGRRVALKVLRPHIVGDSEARERLAREVSSLRRITSPRIAEILDADPHGELPYVVTRYVPGLSLYHHVAEEGPISVGDLLHFADCLAEALQAVLDAVS